MFLYIIIKPYVVLTRFKFNIKNMSTVIKRYRREIENWGSWIIYISDPNVNNWLVRTGNVVVNLPTSSICIIVEHWTLTLDICVRTQDL